jgi:hypothetical protein
MPLDLKRMPDNTEISEILAAQVRGIYWVVNDAWNPYVQLIPSPGASLTVRASDRLRLTENAASKSTAQPMTFVVMYDDAMDLFLAELFSPGARVLKTSPLKSTVDWPIKEKPSRPVRKTPPLIVQPEPSPPRADPQTSTVPVLPLFQEIRDHEDVQPALGDYLVIPMATVSPQEILPPWVVRCAEVDRIHVVKPRLQSDTLLG